MRSARASGSSPWLPRSIQHAILLAETAEQAKLIGSPNQVDAVRANLEKRAPQFTD
jgi:hypothetical protein